VGAAEVKDVEVVLLVDLVVVRLWKPPTRPPDLPPELDFAIAALGEARACEQAWMIRHKHWNQSKARSATNAKNSVQGSCDIAKLVLRCSISWCDVGQRSTA
jgi:hypothetical protein